MADEKVSSISQADTIEQIADFWDTHSLADYADRVKEVEMTFDPAARRPVIGVDPELLEELRQIAKTRHISTQTLINLWLQQKVLEVNAHRAKRRSRAASQA